MKRVDTTPRPLGRPTLRAIERELGVYLDSSQNPTRSTAQQFAVYDEDDVYVGMIISVLDPNTALFTAESLTAAIKALFER